MSDVLESIPLDAIRTAAERLNRSGVFADEDQKFPSLSILSREIAEVEATLRANGYTGGPIAIEALDRPRNGVEFVVYDRTIGARTAESKWYLDYQDRWHNRVVTRVNDWIERLQGLRRLIQSWLPNGMSIVDRPPTEMHEELMRKFNVPPTDMPTFEVVSGSEKLMRVQPKGLWIVGANGRVDLVTARGSWILIDESEALAQTPDWRLYSSGNRQSSGPLNQALFVGLLG